MKIDKYIELHKKIEKLEEQIGNVLSFKGWLYCLHNHYNPPIMSFWKKEKDNEDAMEISINNHELKLIDLGEYLTSDWEYIKKELST